MLKLNFLVRVGESVKRGQLIAELDPEDYRLQLQDTEASLAQAQAQERKAKLDYSRTEDLYENRNASKQDLDAARATQESAELAVESLTNRLELAKRQLAYTRLTAPVAGSIASRSVEPNENVSPGQEVVLLTSESDIEIQVAVPGVIISQIREGDTVSVNFDALPDRRLPGTVTEVGVASTGGATTFPVTVKVDEANEQVRSGMSAEVTFTFGEEGETERYVVPSIAVLEDRDGRFVYVVEASDQPGVGIVKRTPVTIGELVGDGLEIRRGLNDGDDVVIAGVSKIIDGQRVKFGAED